MKEGEVKDIKGAYPLMRLVLSMIERGESIPPEGLFYATYLLARQRGFVMRTGENMTRIVISPRGSEFMERSVRQ